MSGGTTQSLGCFKDVFQRRDLPSYIGQFLDRNSPSLCAQKCVGYPFVGLQWSVECWCGNTFGRHGAKPCTSRGNCPGDRRFGCGDVDENEVYMKEAATYVYKINNSSLPQTVVVELNHFEPLKYHLLEFDLPGGAKISSLKLHKQPDPPEMTHKFVGFQVIISNNADTCVYAAHVLLSGTLVVIMEQEFTPVFGRSYIFMYHAKRQGEFQDIILEVIPSFSTVTLNGPKDLSFVGKIAYGHHYVSIVFEQGKT